MRLTKYLHGTFFKVRKLQKVIFLTFLKVSGTFMKLAWNVYKTSSLSLSISETFQVLSMKFPGGFVKLQAFLEPFGTGPVP